MKLNWGTSIVLFFVVFCSLMIGFMIFAFRQNNDLVTADYYEKGADYSHQMEIDARSVTFRDSIRLEVQRHSIVARFAKSIEQQADTMAVNFYRPSGKKFDYTIHAVLRSDTLAIERKYLVRGRYTVTFLWSQRKERFQVVKEFFME